MRSLDRQRLLWSLLPALLPFAAGLALGATTLGGDFVFDDSQIVRDNPRLENPSIAALFGGNYWGDYASQGLYRPLTLTTFALESALFGRDSATPFHAGNMLLYALCSGLVALLAVRLGARPWVATSAGLLFACHPVHIEVVAGLVGRAELGAALFVMVALANEVQRRPTARMPEARGSAARTPEPRGSTWISAAITGSSALAALCFKESAVALFAVLLLLPLVEANPADPGATTLLRLQRGAMRRWRSGVALVLALVFWGLLRSFAIRGAAPEPLLLNNLLAHRDVVGRLAGALEVSVHYLGKALWPSSLSADYSYPALVPADSFVSFLPWLGLLFWCGAGVGIWWLRRISLLAGAGTLIFVFGLLPVANLVFPIGTIFAERLLFLPSIGVCLVVAATISPLLRRRGIPRLAGAAIVLVLAVLGSVRFVAGAADWRNERSLTEAIVREQPLSTKGHLKLGWQLYRAAAAATPPDIELMNRSRAELERALALYPIEDGFVDTHLNLSIVYRELAAQGRPELLENAERMAEEVLRRSPDEARSFQLLARARSRRGKFQQALELCESGLRLFPQDLQLMRIRSVVNNNLGSELMRRGDLPGAQHHYEAALQSAPEHPEFLTNLGIAQLRQGELDRAADQLERALRIRPNYPPALRAREVLRERRSAPK